MIMNKKNALSAEQCEEIIRIANNKGFQKATVRNLQGETYYDDSFRNSKTVFINKDDNLSIFNTIEASVRDINSDLFNARIENIDLQVAQYGPGDGFNWHEDDPMYPTDNVIWSGRKLTFVYELSNESEYDGGFLEVSSHNLEKNKFTITRRDQKREQGSCVAFPSFFKHKVHFVTRGRRYSLTVWAKGPLWV